MLSHLKDLAVGMGRNGQAYRTIINIIEEANKITIGLSLYVVDGSAKSIVSSSKLVGETLKIADSPLCVEIKPDNKYIISECKANEGALPQENTVRQMRKLRSETKGIDIGDRIPNLKKQGANIQYYHNVADTGIETYQDYIKKGKSFRPSWNLRHLLSPYKYDKVYKSK
jgi:uncharacterized membrane protein YheB (UPF0754 family)